MAIMTIIILLFWSALGICTSNFLTKDRKDLHISGPSNFSDRIAIVGAGASGIDMARRLKKLGYSSIVIYEKWNRVGGKSRTIHDPAGTIQELGSCCIGPGYNSNVIEVIRNYAPPGVLVKRQFGSVWLDNEEQPIPYPEYVMREIKAYFQTDDIMKAMSLLTDMIGRYSLIHKGMFGEYEFELMPRPSTDVLRELNCSYMAFLKQKGLDGLRPLLLLTHTLQGYGYLDEVPAFYGMMWNTPFLMQSLMALASGGETETRPYLLKTGFQNLWQSVIDKEGLNVKLNSKITGVKRTKTGVRLIVNGSPKNYDFLIWSPELQRSLQLFDPLYADEKRAFQSTKADYLVSTLIGLEGGKRAPTPTSYWLDNVVQKRNVSVWATRNTKEAFAAGSKDLSYRAPQTMKRYEIAYQYSRKRPCKPLLKALSHFNKTGVSEMYNVIQKVWRYFPHYSSKELTNGVLWDILEMQGKYKTWYIGSSVSFESLKSVLEYNKLLLSLMK